MLFRFFIPIVNSASRRFHDIDYICHGTNCSYFTIYRLPFLSKKCTKRNQHDAQHILLSFIILPTLKFTHATKSPCGPIAVRCRISIIFWSHIINLSIVFYRIFPLGIQDRNVYGLVITVSTADLFQYN